MTSTNEELLTALTRQESLIRTPRRGLGMTATLPEAPAETIAKPTQRDAALAIVDLIDAKLIGHMSATLGGNVNVYLNGYIDEVAPALDAWQDAITAGSVTETRDSNNAIELATVGRWGAVEVLVRAVVFKPFTDAKDDAR